MSGGNVIKSVLANFELNGTLDRLALSLAFVNLVFLASPREVSSQPSAFDSADQPSQNLVDDMLKNADSACVSRPLFTAFVDGLKGP
jgi:hypothetical protein